MALKSFGAALGVRQPQPMIARCVFGAWATGEGARSPPPYPHTYPGPCPARGTDPAAFARYWNIVKNWCPGMDSIRVTEAGCKNVSF